MGRRAVQDGLAKAIASLFGALDESADEVTIARSGVESLERFGFEAGSVAVLRQRDGSTALETIAATGDRAAFALGTSHALDQSSDAGRALSQSVAVYTEHSRVAEHGIEAGVARWRSGLGTAGSAVLPLQAGEQAVGVMSFEWPDRPPEPRDRAALDVFAGVLALALQIAMDSPSPEHTRTPSATAESTVPRRVTALEVTADGALFPPSAGMGMGLEPVAHLHLASTPANARHAAFVESAPGPAGAVVAVAGVLHSVDDATELVTSAAAVARAAAANATDAAKALGLLAGWLNGQATVGLALSAAVAIFVPEKKALTVSSAGTCAMLLHDHDGRFGMVPPESPPFGGASPPRLENHVRVLLPGDQAVLLIGQVTQLGHGLKAASARDLLDSLQDRNAETVTRDLLGTIAPPGEPGAIVLLELAETPVAD